MKSMLKRKVQGLEREEEEKAVIHEEEDCVKDDSVDTPLTTTAPVHVVDTDTTQRNVDMYETTDNNVQTILHKKSRRMSSNNFHSNGIDTPIDGNEDTTTTQQQQQPPQQPSNYSIGDEIINDKSSSSSSNLNYTIDATPLDLDPQIMNNTILSQPDENSANNNVSTIESAITIDIDNHHNNYNNNDNNNNNNNNTRNHQKKRRKSSIVSFSQQRHSFSSSSPTRNDSLSMSMNDFMNQNEKSDEFNINNHDDNNFDNGGNEKRQRKRRSSSVLSQCPHSLQQDLQIVRDFMKDKDSDDDDDDNNDDNNNNEENNNHAAVTNSNKRRLSTNVNDLIQHNTPRQRRRRSSILSQSTHSLQQDLQIVCDFDMDQDDNAAKRRLSTSDIDRYNNNPPNDTNYITTAAAQSPEFTSQRQRRRRSSILSQSPRSLQQDILTVQNYMQGKEEKKDCTTTTGSSSNDYTSDNVNANNTTSSTGEFNNERQRRRRSSMLLQSTHSLQQDLLEVRNFINDTEGPNDEMNATVSNDNNPQGIRNTCTELSDRNSVTSRRSLLSQPAHSLQHDLQIVRDFMKDKEKDDDDDHHHHHSNTRSKPQQQEQQRGPSIDNNDEINTNEATSKSFQFKPRLTFKLSSILCVLFASLLYFIMPEYSMPLRISSSTIQMKYKVQQYFAPKNINCIPLPLKSENDVSDRRNSSSSSSNSQDCTVASDTYYDAQTTQYAISNTTLRQFLSHPDGFHLAFAPAFFGFYVYFGVLTAFNEYVLTENDLQRGLVMLPSSAIIKEEQVPGSSTTTLVKSVAGASAGAMASVLLAAGLDPRESSDFATTMTLNKFADPPGIGGFFKGNLFEGIMVNMLNGKRLEEGVIPVAVTGFDLLSREEKILTKGCMGRAARASATFPTLFQPVVWSFEDDNESDKSSTLSEKKEQPSFWEKYGIPSALIDGGVTDRYGLNGLTALLPNEMNKRIVNIVVGGFGEEGPVTPSKMPQGLDTSEVVSISIENAPQCGPWAMSNGIKANMAAMNAIISILDKPMYKGREAGHFVLHVDVTNFID